MIFSLVAIVNFEQSTYSVYEPDGSVWPILVFSNPLSSDITVQVLSGKLHCRSLMNFCIE